MLLRSLFRQSMLLLVATGTFFLSGCASGRVPRDALRLHESALDVRSAQTRHLVASSSDEVLAATIAALQDMEFNIDRIEASLGVITASKTVDADSAAEKAGLIMLDVLCIFSLTGGCDSFSKAKDEQRISATFVVLPSLQRRREFVARLTIQRVVFDKAERIVMLERIHDPMVYQRMFNTLSQATFLEVNDNGPR